MNELTPISPPLPFAQEIERDPHLASLHTRRAYRAALARFEKWRAGRPFSETLVEEYLTVLQRDGMTPASVNHALACIRWWARRVTKLAGELSTPEEARRISDLASRVTAIKGVRGSRIPTGRHIPEEELSAMLLTCTSDPSPAGARDAALLAVAYSTGARIHEIQGLQVDDITYTPEGADILLHGKGDKDRQAYLFNGALDLLNAWINLRGVEAGKVFNPVLKNGRILTSAGISLEGLRKILAGRASEAKVEKHLTWHDFRRTLIGVLLDNGTDIASVQSLAGHASPVTTASYDRRTDRRKREAIEIATHDVLRIPETRGRND